MFRFPQCGSPPLSSGGGVSPPSPSIDPDSKSVRLDSKSVCPSARDNLRGYRAPAPKSPPADGEKIAPRRPSTTSQSFADIKNLADRFVSSLKKLSGYDTGAPADLTTTVLAGLCTDLSGLNRSLADLEVELSNARSERSLAYDGPSGLLEKMKSIKQATLAQYGRDSTAYTAVKGIKL